MKRQIFYLIVYCLVMTLTSHQALSQALPAFRLVRSNNEIFSAADLTKGKPVVLIYFDPDCDHCQKLMNELFKKIAKFRKAEIIMATFKSIPEVLKFEKKFDTRKYANIITGTEGGYFFLRNYYGLVKMPFTALYDKQQNLIYSYRQETSVDDLIKRLQALK